MKQVINLIWVGTSFVPAVPLPRLFPTKPEGCSRGVSRAGVLQCDPARCRTLLAKGALPENVPKCCINAQLLPQYIDVLTHQSLMLDVGLHLNRHTGGGV